MLDCLAFSTTLFGGHMPNGFACAFFQAVHGVMRMQPPWSVSSLDSSGGETLAGIGGSLYLDVM